jgi:predicted TIM-barrel fold metal-dependent hydrolase
MRIDCHAHVLPAAYRAALGETPLPPARLDELEPMMERHAIDASVISTGPLIVPERGASSSIELVRLANDGLAEIVRDQPTRFAALATLPLPDLDAALGELERAYDELCLDGVMLLTNVSGTYVGDPRWAPLFEALDERAAYVFLHPAHPPHPLPLNHPVWLYEFTFETVRAAANLIYSGTLERHPRMRVQLAHLGGAVPFLAHRLASLADREPESAGAAPQGALEYLRRLYYDTGQANSASAIAATRAITSIEHVVFGTDWPYAALPSCGDPAPDLDALGGQTRGAIEGEHAFTLVPRLSDGNEDQCPKES